MLRDTMRAGPRIPGVRLFRNTVGAARVQSGQYVTYGLGTGTPDIVGWRRVRITPDMVGARLAVFVGLELKAPGETPTPEQREFLEALAEAGGISGWADSVEDAVRVMQAVPAP